MSNHTQIPTLLIVMGTSGSGKSTVGAALSSALSCPLIDGDDLHPVSNVEKMSRGQPLNDSDREPWLLKIRRTGFELATTRKQPSSSTTASGEMKKLAEVYETSHQTTTSTDNLAAATTSSASVEQVDSQPTGSNKHVAIIACSSLKLIYRRLLRGTITSLDDEASLKPESDAKVPEDLKVIHIYLDLSRELLEERMRNRKGHFMKLDMLYSQLDTLQKPSDFTEPGVIPIKVERETTTDQIIDEALRKLKSQNIL